MIAFRIKFGLKDPLLSQYGELLKGLFTFDFGFSWKNQRTECGRG